MAKVKVRKAVIAAAGFGTRFLPQTKAMPKEMLPLVDKPIIQYIVEELVASGVEDIVIVTGYHKRSIEDHFDYISGDLKANLQESGKHELLDQTNKISALANFAYVRQKGPYGNATPLLNVEHLIGDEPFIYTYADDLFVADPPRFSVMIDRYQEFNACILPCIRTTKKEDYSRYGFITGEEVRSGIVSMTDIIEKPGFGNVNSDIASVGGYLLTPEIFSYLHKSLTKLQPEQEFQIQPAMMAMVQEGKKLYAAEIPNSHYYDAGNKLEYLKTVIDFALKHEDLKDDFLEYLRGVVR